MAKKKQEKPKIKYIDDGRTLADMSALRGVDKRYTGPKGGFREQARTYWNTVKLMFVPMLIVMCALGIIYMLLYAAFLFM